MHEVRDTVEMLNLVRPSNPTFADVEVAHIEADKIIVQFLRDIGHDEVANAYGNAARAYKGFQYA